MLIQKTKLLFVALVVFIIALAIRNPKGRNSSKCRNLSLKSGACGSFNSGIDETKKIKIA